MTISLPGPSKLGLAGLLSKKQQTKDKRSVREKSLNAQEIAQRFSKVQAVEPAKPAKMNDAERQDRARLSNLRGALYSKD